MSPTILARVQLRTDTRAAWAAENPVLLRGEGGYEWDTGRLRIGDGVTPFMSLPHQGAPFVGPVEPAGAAAGDSWLDTSALPNVFRIRSADNTAWLRVAPDLPLALDNLIVNGAMQFWQRANSHATAGYGSADRWSNAPSGGTVTMSRQAFALGDTLGGNNGASFLRQAVSGQSAAADFAIIQQRIEGVRSYAGHTITVLFWARRSSGAGNMVVEMEQIFGTGGSPSASVTGIGVATVALTTAWQPYAITVNVPSVSGGVLGTNGNDFLALNFWASGGADFNARNNSLGIQTIGVDLWGVHIRQGSHTVSAANAYRIPFIADEFLRCQRYYQNFSYMARFDALSAGAADARRLPLPVFMRATPATSWGASLAVNVSSFFAGASAREFRTDVTPAAAGGTDWQGSLFFDAEL